MPEYVKVKNIYWQESSFIQIIKNKIKKFKMKEAFNCCIYSIRSLYELRRGNYFNYEYFLSKMIDKSSEIYDLVISYHAPATFPVIYSIDYIQSRKRILWIHGDIREYREEMKNYIEYYNKYDKIFCISKNIKEIVGKEYPHLKEKTDVFYNIINIDEINKKSNEFKAFKDNFNGIRLLTVGRISDEKGQLIIPEVVKLAKKDNLNIRWYCIGDGELKSELISSIKRNRLENDIILLGSKYNPYPYFKECDIYIQTSKHEGYGLTIHEAKLLNKPIITTRNTGSLEQIENNKNGLIVNYNKYAIYNAINKLVKDKTERERLKDTLDREKEENINKTLEQITKLNNLFK